MKRNIRLIVAYDGTTLSGYQRQANGPTVQAYLEEALSKVCNEPILIYGASRTDAGVHARFQVVTFTTSGRIPVENLLRALIAHLPPYIVVTGAEEIPLDWKPRWNIVGKEYVYIIRNHPLEDPLHMRYHWHVKKPLSLSLMRLGAKELEGTHDFTTLQGTNSTPANPIKTIYAVTPIVEGHMIKLHVIGDGFLYHMVRNIAGLLVDVGLGKIEPHQIGALLDQKDRRSIGKTAPPQGLFLEEIFFTDQRMAEVVAQCRHIMGANE
ncbi:tRNA pseudouridine(38-40) synthase TruA [uncultured Veillonella sp.]|uniref:tRNA pseudouridine(38-40) synthase TruA n=1 Tax=uncultured Veillonella sp. TaxID=159268 RepID=UPI002638F0DB|nr:tRNA pseudouridine(38-40) synthase TruA [uncultured Veillonella sp.]